jgi:2-methylisocitrate lyase-like PEP mutase family enzyme
MKRTLRQRLLAGEQMAVPGVYDGFSAMLVERYPFQAAYLTGYCVAASRFGVPDAGLIGMREMLEAIHTVRRVCTKALIADADTGYGGLLNVQETVRQYEAAGVDAIQIEDQETPKRCGDTEGKRVIPIAEMQAKIEVAVESKRHDDTLIVARTDARTINGFDDALNRARAYKKAGADILFVSSPQSMQEATRFSAALEGPLILNLTPPSGFVKPRISLEEIGAAGFQIAIYPGMPAFAGVTQMEDTLRRFLDDGLLPDNMLPHTSLHELVGFTPVHEDEARWARRFGVPNSKLPFAKD